jgi:Purple acid Phosphatase, N-terminal domain/Calcineurin-like phosphoesterase
MKSLIWIKAQLARALLTYRLNGIVIVLLLSASAQVALAQSSYALLLSNSANRSNPTTLEGTTVTGSMYVFTSPDTLVTKVRFWLDNPTSSLPFKTENNAPYDFAGTASSGGSALPYDTTKLVNGVHTIRAALTFNTGSEEVVSGTFTVNNQITGSQAPDQIHLAWVEDPSTTLTVVWRTLNAQTPSAVEYQEANETAWHTATGTLRASGTKGTLHEATITALKPSTTYKYRVPGDNFTWSPIFTTHTAPPPGPADFKVVFVADTGVIGRLDGLATGTQQVVDEVVKLNPLLVLLGGDMVSFITDKRFGTIENTIDVWFNQMQAIAVQSPMMPTYGNHENDKTEGVASWQNRFPTPSGFNNRKNYSFDIGNAHFVSIFIDHETTTVSSTLLAWVENDIIAAKNAGKTWIIPWFHSAIFTDGSNHPSNLNARTQLGPLFESLGVKLVLSAHDQAYERTFPLMDVPATNTPTSTSLKCYTINDGVTWAKVSPGGKLSDQANKFSKFLTNPAPYWTAFRDNTTHHFSQLVFSASGSLRVDTFGIIGNGSPPVVQDSFEYTLGSCPGVKELTFNKSSVVFTVNQAGTNSQTLNLNSSDAVPVSFSLSDNADWLTTSPTTPEATPQTVTLAVNATGLQPGTYTATVTAIATAGSYLQDTVIVTLNVLADSSFDLLLSASPTRSTPVPLNNASVTGNMYVFTNPTSGVAKVEFWLDNTSYSGTPTKIENNAPHDFKGTATNGQALPYDTTKLANGLHTITAVITPSSGAQNVINASFTVAN